MSTEAAPSAPAAEAPAPQPSSLAQLAGSQPSAPPQISAPPTVAQSFNELLDEKGLQFGPDWTKRLPEHLRPFEGTLSKYPTPFDALAGLGNAHKLISSRESVKLPGPDATPEQWASYRTAVSKITGAPEKMEDYGLKAPESLPEGVEWNGELATKAASIAHKYGVPKEALHELVALNNENIEGLVSKSEAATKESFQRDFVDAMNKEFGADAKNAWEQTDRAAGLMGVDKTAFNPDADVRMVQRELAKLTRSAGQRFYEDSGLIHGDRENVSKTISERIEALQKEPAYQSPKNDTELKRQMEIQTELFRLREAQKNGGR